MQLLFILSLFLVAVAAAPAAEPVEHIIVNRGLDKPSKVRIHDISFRGTGCPEGSADVQVDDSGTLFSAIFSKYQVQTGGAPSDWRKNCKLSLNMEFDQGFQFSIMSTTMSGYADLPQGSDGLCKITYSTVRHPEHKVDHRFEIDGPFRDDFDFTTDQGIISWSDTCDVSTAILLMNTQCSLSPSDLPALIQVDSVTGKLTVIFAVQWRPCH